MLVHQTGSIYQLIGGLQHTYSRGLQGLCSHRDDAPNPQETGELDIHVEKGWGGKDVWDGEQLEGGWGVAKWNMECKN
jgi:hypothetical protein